MENIDKEREQSQRKAVLEVELVKVIETIHEYPNTSKIPQFVREYFVNYCCKNNLSVDEALEFMNSTIKKDMRKTREEIIPESKRGKDFLIRMTLIPNLIKSGAVWREEEVTQMTDTFCEVTGISKEQVAPIVATEVKQKKRSVIENDLYDFIGKNVLPIENPKTRKAASEEAINSFAEVLNLAPKYIKGVLRDKKKKDEAEKKRIEEYRASIAKSENGESR